MARLVPLVVILTVIIIIVFLAGRIRLKSDSDQTALNSGEPVNISTVETEEIPSVDDIPDMRDTLSPTVPVSGGSVFDGLDMMGPAPRVAAGGSVFDGLDMMGPAPRVNAVVGGLDVDILKQMIQSERNLDGSPKSLSDKVESVQNVNDIIDAQISAIDQDAVIAEAILIEQIAKKTAQLTELARVENARLAEAFRVQQNAYTSKMSQFQLAKEQNAAELGDLSKFVSDTRLEQIQFKNNVLNVRATSDLARLLEQKRVDALLDALDGMDDVDDERIRIEGEFADFTAQHDLLESEAIGELDDATDAIAEYELEIARVNGEIEGELQEARNLDTTFENDQSDLFGGVAQDIEGWSEIYNGEDGALNDDGLYFDPVGNVWVVVETESSQSVAISAGRASAESEKDTLEGLRNSLTDLAQSKKDADEVGLGLAKDIADARTVDTTTNAVLRVDGGFGGWQAGPERSGDVGVWSRIRYISVTRR
jgi:xanthosine utilization system XapX-like protein